MTAVELIELLEVHATDGDDRPIVVADADDKPLNVTGIDSYEDALVLVTEAA